MINTNAKRVVHKAKHWLKEQVIQDVPEDVALCEFDCRKGQCRMGEWESCERRLNNLQDFRNWKARMAESTDKTEDVVSIGGTGKRQGGAEAPLLSTAARDRPKPGKRPAGPAHDPGSGKRQGDAEGRLVGRVAVKTTAKQ